MLRKVISICVVITVLLSIMGCANNKEAEKAVSTESTDATAEVNDEATKVETTEATSEETTQEETVATKPSGEITVWGWDYVKTNIDLLIEDFNKEYPDIIVNLEVPGGATDVYQKYLLALTSGEDIPDIVALETSNIAQYVEIGGLLDITDRVAPYIDKITPAKWPAVTMDEKIYGMPWDSGPVGIYYRRDIFEAAGFDSSPEAVAQLLSTWDKYLETAKIIKEKTGTFMFSESIEKPTARTFEIMLWQQNQLYFDKDGKPMMNTDVAKNTLEFFGKFVENDLVDKSEEWTQPWYDAMSSGTVATVINAAWMGGFLSGWIAPDAIGKWGVVPMPTWQEGGARTANSGGSNLAISDATENPDAAWAFVEFYLARKESAMAMYQATDAFPSLIEVYSDPFFNEPLDYYGGQPVRQLFADLADEVPQVEYTSKFPIANEAARTAIQKYFLLGESSQQVLDEAQATVESALK